MRTRTSVAVAAIALIAAYHASVSVPLQGRQMRPTTLVPGADFAWRAIGPWQAGPITAIAGDPAGRGVFYAASAGAGLWKTTDFGLRWRPILDAAPTGTISAVAVAPADSGLIYAATAAGPASVIHRSRDAGVTWQVAGEPHMAIAELLAGGDGRRLVAVGRVSAAGPPAVYLSNDEGRTWEAPVSLAHAGTIDHLDLSAAPGAAMVVLATSAAGATVHRSPDAGTTWQPIAAQLPSELAAAAHPRLSIGANGIWHLAAGVLFESRDDGRSFTRNAAPDHLAIDDVWAHPAMTGVRIVAGPAGAAVTVNDGETWSAPEALAAPVVDHVSVDTAFPYRICATTVGRVACATSTGSRSEWHALPAGLSGLVLADPLEPEVVFGGSGLRYDRRSAQLVDVAPSTPPGSAPGPPMPMAFSADGRTLLAADEAVWRTSDSGMTWTRLGPDLPTGATVSALAVSPIDARIIWMGQDDGRLLVTRNGGSEWIEAERPLPVRGPVRAIEPSRFDTSSAYVVLDASPETGDPRPRLFRTRDDGRTWTSLGERLPNVSSIFVVREDPLRRGLLFAGTDRSAFVSFDDGERWQSLAMNLPAAPVRDLVIKDADVVAATAGRGVWVLDDISPLRQATADVLDAGAFLFRPSQAWRERADAGSAPRLPAAGAAGDARPAALFTYLIGERVSDEVTLEVIDTTTGDLIRRFSSRPSAGSSTAGTAPLEVAPGLHRIAWDLRYGPPVPGARSAPGTAVLPGTYQVRLTVNGRPLRQAITVRMDPRVRTSMVDLTAQRDLGRALDRARAMVAGGGPSAELVELADQLDRLARLVQQVDARPAPRLERAVEAALARASMALGVDTR